MPVVQANLVKCNTAPVDPRLAFLARADALLTLVEAGELNVDDAFDCLMPTICEFADCRCDREAREKFDDAERDEGDDRRRDHHHENAAYCGSRAAHSTVEAILYELRTHGIAQLTRPRTQGRIAELNAKQMGEAIAALRRMQLTYPHITGELVELLQQVRK